MIAVLRLEMSYQPPSMGVAISSNSKYVTVTGIDLLLGSNSGLTFKQTTNAFNDTWAVAISNTGKHQVVALVIIIQSFAESNGNYYGSSMSVNGEYQIVSNVTHYAISSDWGQTWNNKEIGIEWLWMKMSGNASKVMTSDTSIKDYGIWEGACGYKTITETVIFPVTADVNVRI